MSEIEDMVRLMGEAGASEEVIYIASEYLCAAQAEYCNYVTMESYEVGPWPPDPELRRQIYAAYDHRCFYCFASLWEANATLDHMIPSSRGGHNRKANLVACCKTCNSRKGTMTSGEFQIKMAKEHEAKG